MSLRRQVTGALAWAGLVIVIAVPAAETVSSHLLSGVKPAAAATEVTPVVAKPKPATQIAPSESASAQPLVQAPAGPVAPAAKPPVVASIAPAASPIVPKVIPSPPAEPAKAQAVTEAKATEPADPVKDYLATNKTLPSYIKPVSKPDAAAANPVTLTPAAQDLSAKLDSAAPPAGAIPAASGTAVASTGTITATPEPPPLPMPVTARPKPQPDRTVTEADLKDWKSGTLEDYLKSHGLLSGGNNAQGGGF